MKVLIVDDGMEGSSLNAVREILKSKEFDVQRISLEEAGRLTSFKNKETQQLLSLLPKKFTPQPVNLNRAERRRLKRMKR